MREKIRTVQKKLAEDPKFRQAVDSIRPKRNFWGLAGIIIFFFLPELATYIWQDQLVSWAHVHSITEPASMIRMMYGQLESMFASGVSYFNLAMGTALLFWWWRSA